MIVEKTLLMLAPLTITAAVVEAYVGSVTELFESITLALHTVPF